MELATTIISLILSCASGDPVTMDQLADELARRDVVFLGEEHDNDAGHRMQLETVEALHARRGDLVISMEMFERDVQGALDDYVRGRIDEKTFRAHARPWANYEKHYRPIVEFARQHGLDVIAANAPRRSARKMAREGSSQDAYVARETTAPEDRYFELFKEAMSDHPGEIGADAMRRMYAAQCLKDDTMAESIADYLTDHSYRRPLIVHLCGRFHSDYGLGTVSRLLSRRPLTQVSVVTMVPAENPENVDVAKDRTRGHFMFVVAEQPKKEAAPADAAAAKLTVPAAKLTAPAAKLTVPAAKLTVPAAKLTVPAAKLTVPAAKVEEANAVVGGTTPKVKKEEEPPAGKAALGLMPDYAGADEPGVVISDVSEGRGAEKAGLRSGDRIIKIGKESVESLEDYMDVMSGLRPGQVVTVVAVRDGEEKKFQVTLSVSHR